MAANMKHRQDLHKSPQTDLRRERARQRERSEAYERELKRRKKEAHRKKHAAGQKSEKLRLDNEGLEKSFFYAANPADTAFILLVLLLTGVGLIMLFSASYTNAYYYQDGNGMYFVVRQGLFAVAGVAAMIAVSYVNYQKLHYYAIPVLVISILLLGLVLVPGIGVTINKATRWLPLFSRKLTFQPSEIVKIGVIMSFSSIATIFGPRIKEFRRGMCVFLGLIGLIAGLLYFEPHLSATIIIAVTGMAIVFVAGARIWHFLALVVGAGGLMGVYILFSGHVSTRLKVWLDPFIDPLDKGYQAVQSFLAIGSGGFWGVGLGRSRQKQLYLPMSENDFIFSVICEELGFVGAVLIIVMFAALIIRGYWIAMHARDKFGCLLAVGVTTQIAVQTVVNLCVVTGLMPVTGAALPFFSYGGTSLMIQLAEVGILLSVSRQIPAQVKG